MKKNVAIIALLGVVAVTACACSNRLRNKDWANMPGSEVRATLASLLAKTHVVDRCGWVSGAQMKQTGDIIREIVTKGRIPGSELKGIMVDTIESTEKDLIASGGCDGKNARIALNTFNEFLSEW